MIQSYLPLFVYAAVCLAVPIVISLLASYLGPRKPEPHKYEAYESGFPTPPMHGRFPIKFYLIAMLFVIFDIEVVAFYPWAVTLREFKAAGLGGYALSVMLVYVGVLGIGYAYEWKKGGLTWK